MPKNRVPWHYIDSTEAFACHANSDSKYGYGGHIGAIARGYHNVSYPYYYLSVLQTSLAMRETFFPTL